MVIPSYPMQVMAPATGIAACRPPALLQAVSVLDLIELTARTVQSAELLNLSQPTVSRRSRSIAQDLGVQLRQPDHTQGLRCGDGACLRLLRRAAKRHRLEAGVAPPVVLESTSHRALSFVPLEVLHAHAWEGAPPSGA